jgi:2-oxoglutarate dehydrogenase complex dehydrogenase (E1) component-like enzyme
VNRSLDRTGGHHPARHPATHGRDALAARHGSGSQAGAVSRLVQIYANRGHLIANLDPLGIQKRPRPRAELGYFGERS